jgi:hypothetical protein
MIEKGLKKSKKVEIEDAGGCLQGGLVGILR